MVDRPVSLGGATLLSGLVSWKMSPLCGVTAEMSNGASQTGDVALEGALVIGRPVRRSQA